MKTNSPPSRRRARGALSRLLGTTALLTATALRASALPALANVPSPAGPGGGFDPAAAAQLRQDQCLMSSVLRQGGPAMKQVAATALDGTADQLHAAADTDTRFHSTPLHDAFTADSKAVSAKSDELNQRHFTWEAPLANLPAPEGFASQNDFRWAPGFSGDPHGDFFDQTGLGPWLGKRMWTTEGGLYQDHTPQADDASSKAVKSQGAALYPQYPDPTHDPNYLRDANEYNAWQSLAASSGLSADDTRIFLENGGFPRSAPQPGTAAFRVGVEDLKARFASCDSTNPDHVDPNKVLSQEVQTASAEWQTEIASQQTQRDAILASSAKATAALQAGSQALGEAMAQSWLADHLGRWQAYWLPGGKGAAGNGPVVFHLHTASGNCLDVDGNNGQPHDGTTVQAWGCNSTAAQQWRPSPTGALVNGETNLCLDVDGTQGPQHDGTRVQVWDCNGSASQQWQFDTTNGLTRLYNVGSQLCLDLHTPNWGQASQMWDCNGTGAQQFDAQQDNTGTGTGTDNPSYPKQSDFDAVNNALAAAQQTAKAQWQVTQQQAAIAQQAAQDTTTAQQQAWAIADAAGQPRGRGLLAGQQEAQATLASAAALTAVSKAAETAYDATTASGSDSQTLQALAQTQTHAAQAAFRSTAAQAAADQAKAAADGAALQARNAEQANQTAQADLVTAQGAEQTAKQAADTAHTKRQAAEAAQATAADAKNKAAAAQTKAAGDRATAQQKDAAATAAASAASTAGTAAAQKKDAAQQADQAAQQARGKAWDAEQQHNVLQAKADSADAYAAAQATGTDAQAAKDAAGAADKDASDAGTAADQASAAAKDATAAAQTADAEATRAQGAAAQAQSAASDAQAAKATADAAVRADESAAADAMAASDRASTDAATAQKDAATAQAQADTARQNAIQAWAQAGQAQTTAATAAGYAHSTAQAATAASSAAQQVAAPANDAIQLGAPYQDSDSSAGLAVLTGQASKTIADQQQAVAQAKAQQAQQAADQAASLANAATGDAQAADLAAANAAASAAQAQASAKDALASAAHAAQAAADAQASQARAIQYDTQAAADAAASQAAAQGAAGDATDAHNSAVAATDDAGKAWAAAGSAQAAAATAREVAAQADKDATAAAAAAKDAEAQAAAAQQSAVNAEKLAAADQEAAARTEAEKEALAQQAAANTGGATGLPGVFTQQQVTPIGDPTPDNECKLTTLTSFCDVTFTLRFSVKVDFYMQLPEPTQSSDIPGPAASYDILWLGSQTSEVDRKFTQRFTAVQIVWQLSKAVIESVAQSLQKDSDECSRSNGTSPSCVTGLSFLPQGQVAKAAEMALDVDKAVTTGVDLEKALAAVKIADLQGPTREALEEELTAAEQAFASCSVNSFPSDTQVLLADGTYKAIGAIRTGDQVLATDPQTGASQAEPVTAAFAHSTERLVDITLTDGGQLTSTAGHRVYVAQRGWTYVSDLHAGDLLRAADGSPHSISGLRSRDSLAPQQVYDLTVDGLHTFYVRTAGARPQDLLVHNCLDLLADEGVSGAHTLTDHVLSDDDAQTRADKLGTATAWTDKATAVRAVNKAFQQWAKRGGNAKRLANWLTQQAQRRGAFDPRIDLLPIQWELRDEDQLGKVFTKGGPKGGTPTGKTVLIWLKYVKGHTDRYVVYTSYPQ
ncbi:RICIN domain-containing protein [Kitasatospora sp. NPDC052896]|uniref:RICIN domain-containing protein n=1 Tax=Kitasatospora sp. NPDC052896 TaxID=3364061 RepID=UPI0037CC1097